MTISSEDRFRPVVAWDVDGVLRVQKLRTAPVPAGFTQLGKTVVQKLFPVEVLMEQSEYPTLFHGRPHWDENGQSRGIDYFSVDAASLLRTMVADSRVDPVWATTWQRWANTYFAPHLGIPELPVAVKTLEPEDRNWFQDSPSWKSYQLSRQFDGRPLIWLDDNMPNRPSSDLTESRRPIDRALTLSYWVNPSTGITEEDAVNILRWIDLASTPEGQKQLRNKRAHELGLVRADQAKRERRWDRERAVKEIVQKRVEEIYPGQDYFCREIAALARSEEGLTDKNLAFALKRHSLQGDPAELGRKLRVARFHRATPLEDPIDGDF